MKHKFAIIYLKVVVDYQEKVRIRITKIVKFNYRVIKSHYKRFHFLIFIQMKCRIHKILQD